MLEDLLQRVPVFVLVVFRLAGVMLMTPVFSSPRTPRRVKGLLVIVTAFGVAPGVKPVPLPNSVWDLAVGIGGELAFGLAMGILVSLAFVAAQWAGEMIGIEMGLNMNEIFDPSMGSSGSIMGDVYYFMTLAVFLAINGHHQLLTGVRASFDHLPLLSLKVNESLLQTFLGVLQSATTLAIRLAAPMLITVLVVDLALGLIGRAMPQFNVMQAGMSMRSLVGLAIVVAGWTLTVGVMDGELQDAVARVSQLWSGKPV